MLIHNTHKYNGYIIGLLSSPLTLGEGVIDVVADVRNMTTSIIEGKTGSIDVRHFEGF